jgi:hypothetical protein
MLAKELGLDPEKDKPIIDIITKAAQDHQNGKSAEDTQYKNGIYADLMTAASSGSLDGEAVRALAKKFGFTNEDEINALVDAATRRNDKIEDEKTEATENNRLENDMNLAMESGDVVGYIDKAIKANAISKEAAGQYLIRTFQNGIDEGNINPDDVRKALDAGYITGDDLKSLQEEYSKNIDYENPKVFYEVDANGNKTLMGRDKAYTELTKIIFNPLVSDKAKLKIAIHAYNSYYKDYPNSAVVDRAIDAYNTYGPIVNPEKFKEVGYR